MAVSRKYDVIIIGSGPGGLAAAISAKRKGAGEVLVIERDKEPGGILVQCIHNGFGLEIFKEDLTGPSYAHRFIQEALSLGVEFLLDTMVLDITPKKKVVAMNMIDGLLELEARALVLSMGCRERTRPQIMIPGTRPAGIFTAGTAQRFVNVEGYMPGKNFVILGSGDIGMIMARRLTLEGAKVERVLEIMPYLSGLTRNYVQCLVDYDIPLQLSRTISKVYGSRRVEAVESVMVDENFKPIEGTREIIPCDTLLLSVGLIPENELSKKAGLTIDPVTGGPYVDESLQTSVPGIFAAGNVVQVYDLVDWVTEAGYVAGSNACDYALGVNKSDSKIINVVSGENIRYIIPQRINKEALVRANIKLNIRVKKPMENKVALEVVDGDKVLLRKNLPYVRPGEMIITEIPQKIYDSLSETNTLIVRIMDN